MYQSTHLAVAVAGVGASLPGAVAPDELAFVGLVEGFGGGVVVGGAHGSGGGPGSPLGRVVGCRRWTGDLDPWSLWWTRPSRSPPSRCLRCQIACSRALPALSVSMRALVAQPTMRRAYRSMTNAVQRVPRPGRHVGAGRPPICGSGRWRRESRRSRSPGPGPPRRARWRAPSCPARRRSVPAPACAAPRCTGPPRGPPAGC